MLFTAKVRVVFDGSAQCDPGLPSLNDILETGPSTVPAIFDILLCFHSCKIPLVADITQAFHQICVCYKTECFESCNFCI